MDLMGVRTISPRPTLLAVSRGGGEGGGGRGGEGGRGKEREEREGARRGR